MMTAKKEPGKDDIAQMMCERWQPLTDMQHALIRDNLHVERFKKNEIIYKEYDSPDKMLCLVQGKVKIYKDGVGGRNQIVRAIKPFDLFGYRAYFANEHHQSAAMALEPSTIASIPMTVIEDLLQQSASVGRHLISELACYLGKSDERTVSLTQKHIRGRLAEALLFLKDNYGVEEDGYTISIYLSREDLANLSNMTTSNAIRTLSAFADERLVTIDGRKIKIINENELRRISNNG